MNMQRHFPRSQRSFTAGMAFCLVPALAALAVAADPPAAAPAATPATAPADGAVLEVVVLEIKGTAQVSTDNEKTWTAAKVGQHVSQGASFRTGFRSAVTCGIPPDQAFTLESLSTVRVGEAIKKGKRFKTDLVMKYGSTNYSIETGGAEHESTIRTPGSTLSVRGTVVQVTDRPGFAPSAVSFTGRALFKTARGTIAVGSKGGKYARVTAGDSDAAQSALSETVVDPAAALARTTTDARLIAQQVSLGALVSFDNRADIPVIRDSAPFSDAELLNNLPGTLDFVLRWTGNADLNLVVYDQPLTAPDIAQGKALAAKGLTPAPPASGLSDASLGQIALTRQGFQPKELLFPGFGLNVSPTGGVIPYDNRGGPQGGMEIAYWPGTAPQGIFGVAAIHKSGLPVNYTINAFYNGSPLPITYSNSTASSNIPILSTNELKGTATGGINDLFESGVVLFPYNSYLESQVPQGNGETLGYVASPTTPSASHAVKPVKHNNTAKPAPASAAPASAAPRAAPVRTR
jgi:hypothetical protein